VEKIPKIKELLEKAGIPEISKFIAKIKSFDKIKNLIESSIKDNPPITIKEGNLIKEGYDANVDDLRDILNNGKQYLLNYENEQKKRYNLTTGLKVGHNNILGYYIEITLKTLQSISKTPEDYIERATLKNAKRYTTEKLKELEEKIISAQEKINDLEYEVFNIIREEIEKEAISIIETASNIAVIDVLACFAEIAEKYNYSRPLVNNDSKIMIKEGRHPVVEQMYLSDKFIPNDCYLDNETEQILIITGPNMAGKSTYLRQVALICLIAQMGCFVPAKSATIGIIDNIFTRIGASDDLARRLSTFMIEMTETAKILHYATPKSLIIIDELGRGTSTSDGQSIAMATLEKLHELKAKTLFSTHYHQLTDINLLRIKNYHLNIIENEDGSINFVRKLNSGSTDKSYGIHVARLAGIPEDVIIRAFEILEQIEKKDPFKATVRENGNSSSSGKYHDKFIDEKIGKLEMLKAELKAKEKELAKCDEDLEIKENELLSMKAEAERLKHKNNTQVKKSAKKKLVQTSFFKPVIVKEKVKDENIEKLVELLKEIDINSITPVDAMKKLIEMKEKFNDFKLE